METAIFLLHGAGVNPHTLVPLQNALNEAGYHNTHLFRYPMSELPFDECLSVLSELMERCNVEKNDPIIVIGQSLGGVFVNNLHRHGWTNIRLGIYICSPLAGARILKFIHRWFPNCLWRLLCHNKTIQYKYIMEKEPEDEPPHPYATVSTSLPFMSFDGCVHADETVLNPMFHHHIPWSCHWSVFRSRALAEHVVDLLDEATLPGMEISQPQDNEMANIGDDFILVEEDEE